MGGDGRYMLPEAVAGGRRTDGRNLFDEYEAAGYTIVTTAEELESAMSEEAPEKLLGMFHSGDMNVWLDRNVYTENLGDFTDQPSLVDMTLSARAAQPARERLLPDGRSGQRRQADAPAGSGAHDRRPDRV